MTAPLNCDLCPRLCASRGAVVNGSGPQPADVMVVTDHPIKMDERHGLAVYFKGWMAKRLRNILLPSAGFNPDDVRFENLIRCRPPKKQGKPGDEKPKPAEITACTPFLIEEIRATQPKLIITLGDAALRFFDPTRRLASSHGQEFNWALPPKITFKHITEDADLTLPDMPDAIRIVPMYHPLAAGPGRDPHLAEVMLTDWAWLGGKQKETLGEYTLVTGEEMAQILEGEDSFAFDFETTDPNWRDTFQARRADPIGYSVAVRRGRAFYTTDSIENIRRFLEDDRVEVYAHNAKFEYIVAKRQGIRITNLHCTKVMAFLLRRKSTGLKDLTWAELGIKQTRFEDVDWDNIDEVVQYAAADSDLTLRHAENFTAELKESRLWELYETIERPLLTVIGDIELNGVLLDTTPLDVLREKLEKEKEEIDEFLNSTFQSDPPINWDSGAQIARCVYGPPHVQVQLVSSLKGRATKDAPDVRTGAQSRIRYWPVGLGLPVTAWTDTRAPKTDMNTLRAHDHPVTAALVKRASIVQVVEKDLIALPYLVQEDGRIHSSYHQAGGWEERGGDSKEAPQTGRTSSSGPNAQNITHHGDSERPYVAEWGYEIRKGFVAGKGRSMVVIDVGQEEPRIGGFLAGCDLLLDRLQNGDVYLDAAMHVFKRPLTKADIEERQIGKRNFMAWLNRAGSAGIRQTAYWLKRAEAEEVVEAIRADYPEVENWWAEQKAHLWKHGYVETYFGRRIYRPHIWTGDAKEIAHAERAIAPDAIQGTAADVLKLGLPRIANGLRGDDKIVMTIHDEAVVECAMRREDEVIELCAGMTEGILPIHLPAEVSHGPSWAEQERVR